MTENVAEANVCIQQLMTTPFFSDCLAVSCVYSTCRTYMYLHNQEAQKSCHLGSYDVDNKMIIKTLYIVGHSSENVHSFYLVDPVSSLQ